MQITAILFALIAATTAVSAGSVNRGGRCFSDSDCQPAFACFTFINNEDYKTVGKCREIRGLDSQCADCFDNSGKLTSSFAAFSDFAACERGLKCAYPKTEGRTLNEGMIGTCQQY
ncbi:UNVERIFIED_CONTAM: hypothetical protein HDU68_007579 [Siphonaria sp. JEL0065]|nr:hypothetical protein HDU68_007579 [Siphonaria sp. JEL0065]